MYDMMRKHLQTALHDIRAAGLYKAERLITSPQQARVEVAGAGQVLNLCANNYLGLADHPTIIAAAKSAMDEWGYGMASVRFICGTQTPHKRLEKALSTFLGTPDTILYGSCFDANGGLFEALLGPEDVVISDELNHASIIDGIRLSKARRVRYRNRDMTDLREQLRQASDARFRMIATDGVFSMDGYLAPLDDICQLADEHDALVMVDDSHAVGVLGPEGRGTPAMFGVGDRVDIVTGTLGKALGGASGGYVSGRAEIVELLRQRSRPYLFSNSVPPAVAAASLVALDLLCNRAELRQRLFDNATYFRALMKERDFVLLPGEHPIIPVMVGDAPTAVQLADRLLAKGVYVTAFSYPVVPHGNARIRTQMSAAHTFADLDLAAAAFVEARAELDS